MVIVGLIRNPDRVVLNSVFGTTVTQKCKNIWRLIGNIYCDYMIMFSLAHSASAQRLFLMTLYITTFSFELVKNLSVDRCEMIGRPVIMPVVLGIIYIICTRTPNFYSQSLYI